MKNKYFNLGGEKAFSCSGSIKNNSNFLSSSPITCGERDMIDLLEVVKNYYYDPYMGGSNSIKAVLPAVLNSSKQLQQKYSKPIAEIGLSSMNFDPGHVWFHFQDGKLLSRYKVLPRLFEDSDDDQLDATVSDMENIADGGAALTAYGKLQYTDMPEEERLEIRQSLLKL